MKTGEKVKIVNEEGTEEDEWYEFVESKGKVAVVKKNGKKRNISLDRVIGGAEMADEPEKVIEGNKSESVAKSKPVAKFEKSICADVGILFKKPGTSKHGESTCERYYIVSKDFKKWRSFQTYNGSLGKKGELPALHDIKESLSGDEDAVQSYLTKKGYELA